MVFEHIILMCWMLQLWIRKKISVTLKRLNCYGQKNRSKHLINTCKAHIQLWSVTISKDLRREKNHQSLTSHWSTHEWRDLHQVQSKRETRIVDISFNQDERWNDSQHTVLLWSLLHIELCSHKSVRIQILINIHHEKYLQWTHKNWNWILHQ